MIKTLYKKQVLSKRIVPVTNLIRKEILIIRKGEYFYKQTVQVEKHPLVNTLVYKERKVVKISTEDLRKELNSNL